MALLWADGFDHYGNGNNGDSNNALHLQGVYGGSLVLDGSNSSRTGDACLASYAFDNGCQINLPAIGAPAPGGQGVPATGFCGFAFKVTQMGGDRRYQFTMNGQTQWSWRTIDGGAIEIWQGDAGPGNGGTFRAVSALGVLQVNTYSYIEFEWRSDPTYSGVGGYVKVRVNGATVINVPFVTGGNINGMRYLISGGLWWMDDFVWMDDTGNDCNGLLGDIRCRTTFPSANGPDQQWPVTGAATAHEAVATVPPNGGRYVAGQNVGDATDFGMSPLPVTTGAIFAMVMVAQLGKTDAGACTVTPSVVTGAQNQNGPDVNPGTGPGYYQSIFHRQPDGSFWNKGAFNASLPKLTRTA